ncbi:hypothetical protein NPIL_666551, partial [Nephila pilipes]
KSGHINKACFFDSISENLPLATLVNFRQPMMKRRFVWSAQSQVGVSEHQEKNLQR